MPIVQSPGECEIAFVLPEFIGSLGYGYASACTILIGLLCLLESALVGETRPIKWQVVYAFGIENQERVRG